jgi:very-short-patch-repair endonuclease
MSARLRNLRAARQTCGQSFDSLASPGEGGAVSRVVAFLTRNGGFCTRAAALEATSRAEVEAALAMGAIVWISRGRYALPDLELAVMTAHGMNAVLSHTSAVVWHGWELKNLPEKTHVIVPRRRRTASAPLVRAHHVDLRPEEVRGAICTSPERTLVDCLRTLPFDEALVIADSALRHGVDPEVLPRIGGSVRGPGRPAVLRVVRAADGRAANPFESTLRAIAMDVPGLQVQPQRLIVGTRQTVRPDLVDMHLHLAIEADSFEWHGGRADLKKDARRYNFLVADGWLVLRFSWEDVMFDPAYVLDVLQTVVHARTQVLGCPRGAA